MRLGRPVIELEDGHHRPEADEERRHARTRKYDGAAADPGKEGTAALVVVGCVNRFPMGVVLSLWRTVRFSVRGWIGRRTVYLALRGGVGCVVHERDAARADV